MADEQAPMDRPHSIHIPRLAFGFVIGFAATCAIALASAVVNGRLTEWSTVCKEEYFDCHTEPLKDCPLSELSRCYPRLAYSILTSTQIGPSFLLFLYSPSPGGYDPDLHESRVQSNFALGTLLSACLYGLLSALLFHSLKPIYASIAFSSLYLLSMIILSLFFFMLWQTG
jgi:hypothetical protein